MAQTPADRARAYRIRQARRIGAYRVEVSQRTMEAVIEVRGLSDEQAGDRAHLELQLSLIVEEYANLWRKKNRHA